MVEDDKSYREALHAGLSIEDHDLELAADGNRRPAALRRGPTGPRAPRRAVARYGRLRVKLERHPARPQYLVTVRGVGFRFDIEGRGELELDEP